MTDVETIKAAIVAELLRQNDEAMRSRSPNERALDHVECWPGDLVTIDGTVHLTALALAILRAQRDSQAEGNADDD